MKKIAIIVSDEFKMSPMVHYLQKILLDSAIQIQNLNATQTVETKSYDSLILLTHSADSSATEALINGFHADSKPIVGFSDSAKVIARVLKKQNPVIAISSNDSEKSSLKKMGIDTEDCPSDDFITDRYTKIISSSYSLSDSEFDQLSKTGLIRLCKELVEMC